MVSFSSLSAFRDRVVSAQEKTSVLPTAAPEREVEPAQEITVSADIVGARGRAYKVYAFGRRVWLPKSQVKVEGGNITLPLWLAKQKGLA